ncbi:MAG: thymidine kinase [Clostridia bacterium]|nr:thymidine kinase [Clostridia bacterium]
MSKLYFKYGVMGSSKSAVALMTKYNYEQKGFQILLLKPSIDTRDGDKVCSRIGISCDCFKFDKDFDLLEYFKLITKEQSFNGVIVDEVQFCTKQQIEQLREISNFVPVICFGLKTNFKSELFEGSKRLIEIADNISEIKTVCKCGNKAIINAKVVDGKMVKDGNEIDIGGDEKYISICYNCWNKGKAD